MSDASAALHFRLEAARARLENGAEWGPLSAEARGRRLVLVGDWTPWFDLLAQRASLLAGHAELNGRALVSAVRSGSVGLALRDPPLPSSWDVARYLRESAALSGNGRRAAEKLAADTLRRFELGHLAKRPLPSLRSAERRVASIAAATLASPAIICCELPLFRLENAAQAYVEEALERASEGRCSIVSLSRVPALGRERALAERADAVLALEGGKVVARSPEAPNPAPPARLLVTVAANADAFARALTERELVFERLGRVDAFLVFAAPDGAAGYERFAVTASGPETANAVLERAHDAAAPIIELVPEYEG